MSETPAAGQLAMRYALAHGRFALEAEATLAMRGITGVFGPSGAGKTSLLRCIAGLDRPDEGRLIVDGEVWQDTARGIDHATHKRDIGYVFQEPRLFPHLDVRGNLDYGRRRAAARAAPGFDEVVDLLGLGKLLARQPDRLSGGEAQRVAIGRALLRSPRLVLMDEPLAALDEVRRNDVLPFLDRLHANLAVPMLYVSHRIDEICRLCDQLLVIDQGRALACGALGEVLQRTDLPVLGGDEACAVLTGPCTRYDDAYDLSAVSVSAGELWVPGHHDTGATLRLRLRANDISLCLEPPGGTSILNILPATVESLQPESGASILVHLLAGEDRLTARVTRRSSAELGLEPDRSLYCQIKSVSVRPA